MITPLELPDGLVAELETPQLVVDLDLVRANVARVLRVLGGDTDRWRPHLKTTKSTFLWRELLAVGVRTFKCATALELEVLLRLAEREDLGVDVLVALPHRGANLQRLGRLAESSPRSRVAVLVEDEGGVREAPTSLGLFVDLDVGMGRTGIDVRDRARHLAVARAAGARLRGAHAYEGHEDGSDGERAARLARVYEVLSAELDAWSSAGLAIGELITSGTPGFETAAEHAALRPAARGAVHRVSPGTVVLGDLRSLSQCPDLRLVPAARVLARVVSRPRANRITLDAGSKALAAEVEAPIAEVCGSPAWRVLTPSEEHLPIEVDGPRPEPGALVQLVPRHICPTVNLARRALVIERGRAPRFEAIDARGHGASDTPVPSPA